jgi:tetratricopeptide (TPR) repeat protein
MDLRTAEREANAQFARGLIRESARTFLCLCDQLPQRLDLQARLGYLALLVNDLDAAVNYLTGVINRGLRSRQVLAHLAEAYYRQGRLGSAAFCYQRLGRDGLAATLAVMDDLEAYRLAQPKTSAELPWVTNNPLPVLPARINGRSANLMLDTGAG